MNKKNNNFAQKLATTHGTFNSFSALADALDVKAPEKREPRPIKCKVCGGKMTRAGNSNVWVCNNEVEKKVTRNGEEVTEKRTCGNYTIRKNIA